MSRIQIDKTGRFSSKRKEKPGKASPGEAILQERPSDLSKSETLIAESVENPFSFKLQEARILQEFRQKARETGFDVVRITQIGENWQASKGLKDFIQSGYFGDMGWLEQTMERRSHPKALWTEAKTALVFGLNYAPPFHPMRKNQWPETGNISVYAQNEDYHDLVKKRLKTCARWLVNEMERLKQQREKYKRKQEKLARKAKEKTWVENQTQAGKSTIQSEAPEPRFTESVSYDEAAFQTDVKVFVDTAPLMEKPLAMQAGLGWQGKHTNLVSRRFGSWLFLGVILTNLPLTPEAPEQDHCGNCRACLDVCPTQAFIAPYKLDARRCISYLTIEHKGLIPQEFRKQIGNRIYGCDDCLSVCPWNKFAQTTEETAFHARPELQAPLLQDLVQLEEKAFREIFSKSPVKRIGRDRFIRNVLIALGNTAKNIAESMDEKTSVPVKESSSEPLKQTLSTNEVFSPDQPADPPPVSQEVSIVLVCQRLEDPSWIVRGSAVWALKCLSKEVFTEKKQIYAQKESHPEVRQEWQREKR